MTRPEELPDTTIDSLVLEATRVESGSHRAPDENEIIRYVTGELEDDRSAEIRLALLESERLRGRVAEAIRMLEEVERPEVVTNFEQTPVEHVPSFPDFMESSGLQLAPRPERFARLQRREWLIRALLLLVVALMAYPTFRFFVPERPEVSEDFVMRTVSVELVAGPTESGSMPVVRLRKTDAILELLVPVGLPSGSDLGGVVVSGPGGSVRTVDWTEAPSGNGIRVLLSTAMLSSGVWSVDLMSSQGPARFDFAVFLE